MTLSGRESLLGGTAGFWGMDIRSTSLYIIFSRPKRQDVFSNTSVGLSYSDSSNFDLN